MAREKSPGYRIVQRLGRKTWPAARSISHLLIARFDVYRDREGGAYFLDCQADSLVGLTTRFVVPLVSMAKAPRQITRLNPSLEVEGEPVSMLTQFSASMFERDLGKPVASLATDHDRIMGALDMLLIGY